MSADQLNEEAIFDCARRIESAEERDLYLANACATNTATLARVRALLEVHDQQADFLEAPPSGVDVTMDIPVTERPGTMVGKYKLMEQIGEGGMGVVYVADQEAPIRRRVALKVIKPGMDSKEVVARFSAERQALALMDHPNIAQVFDAGATDSGRPYFVMELVRGIPITEYCDLHRFNAHQRLELFVDVCRAVQHAHQKGVIHRDIKPSNVLVTEHDGTPVVKVIDFGVAKAINQQLTERTIYTRFQQMVGTPMYMSPEQAELSGLDVDTRSDIYSLGVLLYELLTGATPFDKEQLKEAAFDEIRRIIREQEPSKPSTKVRSLGQTAATISGYRSTDPNKLSNVLRGDLDWIVMKSLEKDRGRRYDTANGLANDIERFVSDEPVLARPPSTLYRLQKMARRNKAVFATGAAVVASLVIGLGAAVVAWRVTDANLVLKTEAEQESSHQRDVAVEAQRVADRERQIAETAREEAAARADELARNVSVLHISAAGRALLRNEVLGAQEELELCETSQRGWEWKYLDSLAASTISKTYPANERPVFSRNGRQMTAVQRGPIFATERILTWDLATHEVVRKYEHDTRLSFMAMSADETQVVAGDESGNLIAWDAQSGVKLWTKPVHEKPLFEEIAFSPDGRQVATASEDNMVKVVDAENGSERRAFGPFDKRPESVMFSPDGNWLAVGLRKGQSPSFLLNIKTKEIIEFPAGVMIPRFDTSGKRIATGTVEGRIQIWNWEGEELSESASWDSQEDHLLRTLEFSPDCSRIVSAGYSGEAHLWDVETGTQLAELKGRGLIYGTSFHPDGRRIALFRFRRGVRVWHTDERSGVLTAKPLAGRARVRFSPDGQRVLSSTLKPAWGEAKPETAVIISTETGRDVARIDDQVHEATWTPDGLEIIAGSNSGIRVYDVETPNHGRLLTNTVTLRSSRVDTVDNQLHSLSWDGMLRVSDLASGEERAARRITPKPGPRVTGVGFSCDAHRVGVGVAFGSFEVRDIQSGAIVSSYPPVGNSIYQVAFSRDGERVYVGGESGLLAALETASGDVVRRFPIELPVVGGIAISPNERHIVIAENDRPSQESFRGRVVIYDAEIGTRLFTLADSNQRICSVDWSSDGRHIAAGYWDGTVQIWTLPWSP